VAIYRDGSKGAQPLNVSDGNKAKVIKNALGGETSADVAVSAAANRVLTAMAQGDTSSIGDDLRVLEDKVSARLEVTANAVVTAANAFSASIANAVTLGQAAAQREDQDATQGPPRAVRHRLPEERPSLTHKFSIAGHEGYITVGLYPNGQPGEIFIKMAKEGSTVSGLMDSFATAVSLSLQHGVPLRLDRQRANWLRQVHHGLHLPLAPIAVPLRASIEPVHWPRCRRAAASGGRDSE
jgi:ribonucleoside-diphosphate reductase alpha chain